jgi:hypothetical protein
MKTSCRAHLALIPSLLSFATTGCLVAPRDDAREPEVVATSQTTPGSFVAKDGTLWWSSRNPATNKDVIHHVGPDGSVENVVSATPSAVDLQVTADALYWLDFDMWKADLDGSNPHAIASAPTDERLDSTALGASAIFVSVAPYAGEYGYAEGGGIYALPFDGSEPITITTKLATGRNEFHPLAVTHDAVVFANEQWIFRAPLGGGERETIAGTGTAERLTADGDEIYYVDDGRLARTIATGGVAPEYLATGVRAYALDAAYVYWSTGALDTLGSVYRMPKAGGAPEMIATKQMNPYAMAVDDRYVYWANGGTTAGALHDGAIMRLAK